MEELVQKYAEKLVEQGLAESNDPLIGGLDAELVWNRNHADSEELEKVFNELNINSLMYSRPAEPYRTIVDFLSNRAEDTIYPTDSEMRTFIHDLPVARNFTAREISGALKNRKSVIIPEKGIVSFGTVSPEQAFVTFSSVCFSCFVKFFADYLTELHSGTLADTYREAFDKVVELLPKREQITPELIQGPFYNEELVYQALAQVGKLVVDRGLVDSFFGNVSLLYNDTLYISQTSSSLDELEGCIDPCQLDGSSCAGMTASTELPAHMRIVQESNVRSILHGHPKFSVIMSMVCDSEKCDKRGLCHIRCPDRRFVRDVPIVPGEPGSGRYGLCNTLPPAVVNKPGAIVYGHGVFTTGEKDFVKPYKNLCAIEEMCREEYFNLAGSV